MRPVKLVMSAWGPYPGKVEIDFTKFEEGSVFLITGATGAGKTTIFDGISYALYGNVSGQNRDKSSVRSDFASPETDTYVEYTFLHKGTLYHIERAPKYERPKKRGEGFTISQERALLEVEGKPPITSIMEVTRQVEQIMGINYEQFKQIAMIAQGEFLNLLYAPSKEKVEIFRNLFKTELYDRIGKVLGDKSKKLYTGISELKNKMDESIASIEYGDNETLKEAVLSEHPNYQEIISLLHEEINNVEKQATVCQKQLEEIDLLQQKKQQERTKGKEHNLNLEQLEKCQKTLEELMLQSDTIEEEKTKLERAKSAQVVVVHETLYKEARNRSLGWKAKLEQEEVRKVEWTGKLNMIGEEEKRIPELEAKQTEAVKEEQKLAQILPLLDQYAQCVKAEGQLSKQVDVVSEQFKKVSKQLEQTKQEREQSKQTLKKYDTLDTRRGELNLLIQQAERKYKDLQQAMKLIRDRQGAEQLLETYQKEYIKAEHSMQEWKKIYEEKESKNRFAAIGLAAKDLVDNEPCPLCGSTIHPKKAVISNDIPDEKELAKDKASYEKAMDNYNEAYKRAATQKALVTSKQEEIGRITKELDIEEIEMLIQAFQETKASSMKLLEERTKLEEEAKKKVHCQEKLDQCEQLLVQLEQSIETTRDTLTQTQKEYEKNLEKKSSIAENIPKEYQERSRVEQMMREYQHKIEECKKKIKEITNRKEKISTAYSKCIALIQSYQSEKEESEKKAEELKTDYHNAIKKAGFEDEIAYLSAKRTTEEQTRMQTNIQEYSDRVTKNKMEQERLNRLVDGKPAIDLSIIDAELTDCMNKKNEWQQRRECYVTAISCNKKAYHSMSEKSERAEVLSEQYGYIKDLENTAKGVNPERLVFEQYVLAAYFEDILHASNIRLSLMTNSRYELLKVDKVTDQRTKDSLDLEVLDHYTGKRRSVKTLSGGESFKAALSLALGLSDIIQQNAGGIEIETLFIDEGFGSLDSESLEQALRTLTTLAGGNKLIGIISHVDELKECIDTQIVIEKENTGSTLHVIC